MTKLEDIKELRQATGAGFTDCRAAIEIADGDFDRAVEALRSTGHGGGSLREQLALKRSSDLLRRVEALEKGQRSIWRILGDKLGVTW